MPVLTTYEWTDNMPYVYLDVLKQTAPITGDSTDKYNTNGKRDFVILGSCDYLHYGGTHDTIAKMKEAHESRHQLCWKFERQPMFLYCHADDADTMTEVFANTDKQKYPLVLSLLQIEKTKMKSNRIDLNNLLTIFRQKFSELLKSPNKGVALWNLGGSDIVLGLRVDKLEAAANVILSLQSEGLQLSGSMDDRLFVYSTSSHCAIALSEPNGEVTADVLREWLSNDKQVSFHMLFEASYGYNGILKNAKDTYMVLGERDYEVTFPEAHNDWSNFLYTQLNKPVKMDKIFHHRTTYVVPEIKLNSGCATSYIDNAELLKWNHTDDNLFNKLDYIKEIISNADFTNKSARANNINQIQHCQNSLLGLIKYAFRLQVTMGQYDLFCYIRRVYHRLNEIMCKYMQKLTTVSSKTTHDHEQEEALWRLVSELTYDLFFVVSELQHLFSILSLSPHTYMETHGSSMRSLNAATKLWDAYNGIILSLIDMFPPVGKIKSESNEYKIQKTIMLSPYRGRHSQNYQLFPSCSADSESLVLIQMDFSQMFRTKLAVYMLAHECGHHLSDSCREERFKYMSCAYFADLLEHVNNFAIICPLYLIVSMAESEKLSDKDLEEKRTEYYGLVFKENKTPDDYRRLLMFSIKACSTSEYKKLYEDLSSNVSNKLKAELVESIESAYEKFSNSYEIIENSTPQHKYYFANALAYSYMTLDEKNKEEFIKDVYNRIWRKVQEILREIIKNGIGDKYTIDAYQQSKLQAFWNFNQSEEIIKRKIEAMIDAKSKKECANEKIELFRKIFADMFAVTVLGLNKDQYFDLINEFADITPPIISNPINLLRIYAVSEVSFEKNCLMNGLESGKFSYPNFNIARAKLILNHTIKLPLNEYIIGYAQKCHESLQKQVKQKEHKSNIEHIRNIFSKENAEESISALWYFWQKSMDS